MKAFNFLAGVSLLACRVKSTHVLELAFGSEHKGQVTIHDGDLKVPGTSPVKFCYEPIDDILQIDRLNVSPNPLVPGEEHTVTATGMLRQPIEDGSYVDIKLKYGFITIINKRYDICENVDTIDKKCPLDDGDFTIKKEFDLPKAIPAGEYELTATAFSRDNNSVTCMIAKVTF